MHKKEFLIPALILLFTGSVASFFFHKGEPELWLNGLHNQFLDHFFYYITELGTGYFFALTAIVFLFYRYSIALILGVQGLIATLITNVLKHYVFTDAPRPPAYFSDHSILHFIPGSPVFYSNSFPSGHSITVFVLCTTLAFVLPRKYSLPLLLLAVLVLVSRMYLLRHFLIDVSVGGLIGLCISAFTVSWLWSIFDKKFETKSLITIRRS
jgi:membrane-associated phospholipid phosphatase